jgi:hypothetical protein
LEGSFLFLYKNFLQGKFLHLKASPFKAGIEQKLMGFLALIAFDNEQLEIAVFPNRLDAGSATSQAS